ncbi:MAG: hypothetical protein ABIG10_03485 [bacterium]
MLAVFFFIANVSNAELPESFKNDFLNFIEETLEKNQEKADSLFEIIYPEISYILSDSAKDKKRKIIREVLESQWAYLYYVKYRLKKDDFSACDIELRGWTKKIHDKELLRNTHYLIKEVIDIIWPDCDKEVNLKLYGSWSNGFGSTPILLKAMKTALPKVNSNLFGISQTMNEETVSDISCKIKIK